MNKKSFALALLLTYTVIGPVAARSNFPVAFANNSAKRCCSVTQQEPAPSVTTRSEFVNDMIGLGGVGFVSAFLGKTAPAYAEDEPSTLAYSSSVLSATPVSASFRNVKRALKQFGTFELYVTNSDYQGFEVAMRNAPFSEVRKNCSKLVRESGDDEKYVQAYKNFISALEKVDATAKLGVRGRTIPPGDFAKEYKLTMNALNEFYMLSNPEPETTTTE